MTTLTRQRKAATLQRPFVITISGGEFSEQILEDLIAEGYSGTNLLNEFRSRQSKIRPAIEAMLNLAKKAANGEGEYSTYDEILGYDGIC